MYNGDHFLLEDKGPVPLLGTSLAIDGQGQAWVDTEGNGPYGHGVYTLKNGETTLYTRTEGGLPSNTVRSLVVDANDRVWFANDWGVAILDGGAWTTYHMSNSGLPDNDITQVVVTGAGPNLPPPQEKAAGAIAGRIWQAEGQPMADAGVEVCIKSIGVIYVGEIPCTGQPFSARTWTGADGRFLLENLPSGFYCLIVDNGDGWASFTYESGIEQPIQVLPGETNDLGDITPVR
jgi:hypothetical protein